MTEEELLRREKEMIDSFYRDAKIPGGAIVDGFSSTECFRDLLFAHML